MGNAVVAAVKAAEAFSPEPPRPLRRELPGPEAYPVDTLGPILGGAAKAIIDRVQCPPALAANSVLAAAALAVQAYADVRLPHGQVRPLSLFLVSVAASGERKSSADALALWPVRERERMLGGQYDQELPAYRDRADAWAAQRQSILKDRKKYPTAEAKQEALEQLGPAPRPPLVPMLTGTEPTLEGLGRLLGEGWPSIGVFAAEGGQFLGGHAMSPDNRLKTAAGLSALWDGEPLRRVRAGDGASILPGRRVSLHLMVQPAVSLGLLGDTLLVDQGLNSRFLVTAPATTCGTRFYRRTEAEGPAPGLVQFNDALLACLGASMPLVAGKDNELAPRQLSLAPMAARTWITFADHIEAQLAPGAPLEPIRGFANKLPEHAARIAGVLTLVADLDAGEAPSWAVEAGIVLAQHYATEAERLAQVEEIDPWITKAEKVLAWLQSWPEPLVGLPEIYRLGPNQVRDAKTARKVVALLEDHGWLVPVDGGGVVQGQKRREVWRLVKEG